MTWNERFFFVENRRDPSTSDVSLAWHRQSVGADEVSLAQHSRALRLRDSLVAHEVP